MSYIIDIPCSCGLDQGIEFNCNYRSPGGNDIDIYITNSCDIDYYTDDNANGVVEEIMLKPNRIWYNIKAKSDSVQVQTSVNATGGFPINTITFQINSLANSIDLENSAAETLAFINKITNPNNKYAVVITDNSGVRYVFGLSKRGLRIADGTQFDSGAAFEDQNGWTIVLSNADSQFAKVLDPSVNLPLV